MLSLILIGTPDHFDDLDAEDDHVDLHLEDLHDDHGGVEDLHNDHQIICVLCFLLLHRALSIFEHLFPENGNINNLLKEVDLVMDKVI